jgi:hypothetical protein
VLFITAILSLIPTPPNDFWWHLRIGQIIATEGIPSTNRFAWSVPHDHPYQYGAWLGQWLLYQIWSVGDLPLIAVTRTLLLVGALGLTAAVVIVRTSSWRLTTLALLIVGALISSNVALRPQLWAWGLFTSTLVVLTLTGRSLADRRMLAILPVLIVLWANLHGSFVLGLALLGLVAVGETLPIIRQPLRDRRPLAMALWMTLGVSVVIAAFHPLGWSVYAYVYTESTNAVARGLISEWQPPVPNNLAGLVCYVSIPVLMVVGVLARKQVVLTDVLLVVFFTALAVQSARSMLWYAFVVTPIMMQWIAALRVAAPPAPARQRKRTSNKRSRAQPTSAAAPSSAAAGLLAQPARWTRPYWGLLTLSLALCVWAQPPFHATLPLPFDPQQHYAPVPGATRLFTRDTPVGAATFLRQHPIEGRMFTDVGYASYFIWEFGTSLPVFIDPRVPLFSELLWEDYLAISMGQNANALLIDTYNVERVVLDRTFQAPLSRVLSFDPHWQREYLDAQTEIYRRAR